MPKRDWLKLLTPWGEPFVFWYGCAGVQRVLFSPGGSHLMAVCRRVEPARETWTLEAFPLARD